MPGAASNPLAGGRLNSMAGKPKPGPRINARPTTLFPKGDIIRRRASRAFPGHNARAFPRHAPRCPGPAYRTWPAAIRAAHSGPWRFRWRTSLRHTSGPWPPTYATPRWPPSSLKWPGTPHLIGGHRAALLCGVFIEPKPASKWSGSRVPSPRPNAPGTRVQSSRRYGSAAPGLTQMFPNRDFVTLSFVALVPPISPSVAVTNNEFQRPNLADNLCAFRPREGLHGFQEHLREPPA